MMSPEDGAVVYTMVNFVISIITVGLCINQLFIDSEVDGSGKLVFINFSMIAKSIGCFKQFITAHQAFRTQGLSEMTGFVCLLSFFIHSYSITITLNDTYEDWAQTTIVVMATILSACISFIFLGMLIPKDHAWSTTAVPVIIILTVTFDAALLVLNQRNQNGDDDEHLLRDLVMKLVEVSITIYRWVDLIRQTHYNPWDAEKILNLVGSGLPVLTGAYQIAWILYKMGIMCKVMKSLRKIHPVFAREEEEEEQPAKAAMQVDEAAGDVEEQTVVVSAPAPAPAAA